MSDVQILNSKPLWMNDIQYDAVDDRGLLSAVFVEPTRQAEQTGSIQSTSGLVAFIEPGWMASSGYFIDIESGYFVTIRDGSLGQRKDLLCLVFEDVSTGSAVSQGSFQVIEGTDGSLLAPSGPTEAHIKLAEITVASGASTVSVNNLEETVVWLATDIGTSELIDEAVTKSKLADNSVGSAELLEDIWNPLADGWETYDPTIVNCDLPLILGYYRRLGKTIQVLVRATGIYSQTAANDASNWEVVLPAATAPANHILGECIYFNASNGTLVGVVSNEGLSTNRVKAYFPPADQAAVSTIGAGVPVFVCSFTYQAAAGAGSDSLGV